MEEVLIAAHFPVSSTGRNWTTQTELPSVKCAELSPPLQGLLRRRLLGRLRQGPIDGSPRSGLLSGLRQSKKEPNR
jgi:hypothetical protein